MFNKFAKLRNKKGFTLIEVMVVVAIIAILAAVAIPAYLYYKKDAQAEVAKASLGTVVDSINGSNVFESNLVGVDESGNVVGSVQDAIDNINDDVTVDSIKLDAPLSIYCVYDKESGYFTLKDGLSDDVWLALYDDGTQFDNPTD